MIRLGLGVIVLALALLVPGSAQDKKEGKKGDDPAKKLKGQLPQYYGKLKLSDEQKQSIYKVKANYKVKRDELEKKLNQLKTEERAAYEKVLTQAQLKKLRELQTGEKGQ
jgi:hypothetical protein